MGINIINNYLARKPGTPSIKKKCRLRNVNMGHYDAWFDVNYTRNIIEGGYYITVKYLSDYPPRNSKMYYKSSTEKAGDFIAIKDVCFRIFGMEEPENGWDVNLKTISINKETGEAKYYLSDTAIKEALKTAILNYRNQK